MPRYKMEDDPLYQTLAKNLDKANREFKKALADLRRYYLNADEIDNTRAAILQDVAHKAHHTLQETTEAFSHFVWEIVPHTKEEEHLERIENAKSASKKRIETAPRKDGNDQVMIITRINGVTRRVF